MEQNSTRPRIFLYTDGASSGNPGPGGYGVVLKCAGREKEMSGGFIRTTNNRMELLAVIKGLEAIKWQNAEVEVFSDSSYATSSPPFPKPVPSTLNEKLVSTEIRK